MRIGIALHTLDPATGGVASATIQLAQALCHQGHTVSLITFDAPSSSFIGGVPAGIQVIAIGPTVGSYAFIPHLSAHLQGHTFDALILNGLWLYSTYGLARWAWSRGIPYYLYPHGMLDRYFRRFSLRYLKKLLYFICFEAFTVHHARALCYTTDSELALAQRTFWPFFYPRAQVVTGLGLHSYSGDITQAREDFYTQYPHLQDTPYLLYLSRIHPKKGLDLLLQAHRQHPDLHLVIAGPIDDPLYHLRLLQIADHGRITWTGLITGPAKWGALSGAQALILTSHQENFGMVVAEALSVGTPVLLSSAVALSQDVATAGAGLVAPDTLQGNHTLLSGWLALSPAQRTTMSAAALQLYRARYTPQAVAARLHDILSRPS